MKFAFLLLVCGFSLVARAASNVKAELHANVSAITDQPFEVGILLTMKPGWHTYFSNPGDAGLATNVKWELPPGFQAGALRFPAPTRFDEPGGIVVYGYEGQVLLTSTITPPGKYVSNQPVDLRANVSWLCCAEVCIPGKAQLDLKLPTAKIASPADQKLFDDWNARLPKVIGKTPPLLISEVDRSITFDVHRDLSAGHATIIPGAVEGLIVKNDPAMTGSTVTIHARQLKGQPVTAKALPIFITYGGATGAQMADEYDVPLEETGN
ncbi:MAG: hypothetical protein JO353_08085 [Phycisphaerae bacterium]|nr:hypothetical protein [Phycisphaerae bacterium]